MKALLLGGGGLGAAAVALPLLAILAVLGVPGAVAGCPPGGALAADAEVPLPARAWVAATHRACPVLPEPWVAAVMAQESAFDPDAYADDANGGTWGLFQLNASVWHDAYRAGWDADLDRNGRPDVRDPAIHARVAGKYLCDRLAGVRAIRDRNPDWLSTQGLDEFEALIVAHNAGESRLASYPELPAITVQFLDDVSRRSAAWSADCPPGGELTAPEVSPAEAIRTAAAMVGQSGWYRRCDRLVCRAYGYLNSGYPTATDHWHTMSADGHARPGDRCPPTGAFAYWRTGAPAGHVALVVSADLGCNPNRIQLISNDVRDDATGLHGGVYLVTLAQLEAGFMRPENYLGWSPPICAGTRLSGTAANPPGNRT